VPAEHPGKVRTARSAPTRPTMIALVAAALAQAGVPPLRRTPRQVQGTGAEQHRRCGEHERPSALGVPAVCTGPGTQSAGPRGSEHQTHALTDYPVRAYFSGMGDSGASLTVMARTGTDGAGLVCTLAEVPPGALHAGTAGIGGELWFVIEGSGSLDLDGLPGPDLIPDRGLWIPAGGSYQLECDGSGRLRLDMVALPPASWPATGNAITSAITAGVPLCRDLRDCPVETTGDRTFRVLFGPGRDCPAATQFVGEIPPGRAPEHSHLYDEVVLVLQGTGVAHAGDADCELSAGTCLHLPSGLCHCLENTGPQVMRVLGVFHPADSPAAKVPLSARGPG
jgi:mannose-6-phosphate isomerase-like protein (cupin superfamily)